MVTVTMALGYAFGHRLCSFGLSKSLQVGLTCRRQYIAPFTSKQLCRSIMTYQQIVPSPDFFFRQMFDRESCTYTYILADVNENEGIIIDPVLELVERDLQVLQELSVTLKYALNTHMHADHVTGTGVIKTLLPECKSVISKSSGANADIHVGPSQTIEFGRHTLEVRATPGHTNGCVTYVCHEQGLAFTGDALLIRGCGRTDFQEGDARTLYNSVHSQILSLPGNFRLYPAHDYKGQTVTTVAEEKSFNPRLTQSVDDFVKTMENLKLPRPLMMDIAVPANKLCGIQD